MQCYDLTSPPFRQQPDPCSETDREQHRRALAFTHLSQSLLFNGKISSFSRLQGNE
jgi:hypothetical protein